MSLTKSNMLALGTEAPFFRLLDVTSGEEKSLDDVVSDTATVIMFWCNHCPYVIHVSDAVIDLAKSYQERGVNFVAISSNDIEKYPQDGPEKMAELAKEKAYPFPYLFDATQNVAKDYDAACTPDFYVFDGERELVYRGQLDGSRPGSEVAPDGKDLRAALDAILGRKPVSQAQRPSAGCNIKWK